jgi:glycerophosphoryl diester phosphodiesterase
MNNGTAVLTSGALWLVGVALAGADRPMVNEPPRPPLVIAHRGASGQRPEHTLAAYQLAAEQGADFIEPDLVITKDGVLVARHEPEIGETTDVTDHPEFASRKTTKPLGGRAVVGWFVEDFTLAELKTLRARERLPKLRSESARFDNQFEIPTFPEILRLRQELTNRLGREIGVYPETKHPARFAALGLPLEERVVADLRTHGLDSAEAPVFLQSFETESLRALARLSKLRRIQLLGSRPPFPLDDPTASSDRLGWLTPRYLQEIRTFADGIGPDKNLVIPKTAEGRLGTATTLVADAHRAGLVVHPYTFREENAFLPLDCQRSTPGAEGTNPAAPGDLAAELRRFLELGIDGFFIDQPQVGVRLRDGQR